MASPFQQQVRQRKILYIGLIIVLFTLSLVWRKGIPAFGWAGIDGLAQQLAIREKDRGEVELVGSVVRLGLTGMRGLVICVLWNNAIDKQKKNQWNELEVLVRALTKLQPHFITPWLFQSWNLAYNVSVESDRVRDKYFYITRGIELLAQGERQNRNHPDLRWSIGFYTQHKICQSDETNVQRSLFQLSLIPPNQRDPARFYRRGAEGVEFNWPEFARFCQEHPQLIRRLREGIRRDTKSDKKKQFLCANPEEVVRFLEDNYNVPGVYVVPPLPPGEASARAGLWDPAKKDVALDPTARFPVLPPDHAPAYDSSALSQKSELRDDTDAFAVSHAWYCYAQEPLPGPSDMPGVSEEIKDPTRQRRPRNMTTMIFRTYPAQGRRYVAERLQQEGWYDDEPYDLRSGASDWFAEAKDPEIVGKDVRIGGGSQLSRDAWLLAYNEWKRCGLENHLLFDEAAEAAAENNMRKLANAFAARRGLKPGGSPPRLRDEDLPTREEKEEYFAARYLWEYGFYRQITNFSHHYERTRVERLPETVVCRKLINQAEQLNLEGSPTYALKLYHTAINVPSVPDWRETKRRPLDAWRDLVLMNNEAFRRDMYIMEQCAEMQLRYLLIYNRYDGKSLKRDVSRAGEVLPLLPRSLPDDSLWIVQGPFDMTVKNKDTGEMEPLIADGTKQAVMERYNVVPRQIFPPANVTPSGELAPGNPNEVPPAAEKR